MLARSAQGLYWMSRYLERAEHLARLLRLQTETLVDRPLPEIHVGWTRIYDLIGRRPPTGELVALESDDFALADAYTLADDLTFERSNPSSVRSCFALGRENARQMRQCISAEMWTSLNVSYLRLQQREIHDVWGGSPEGFFAETAAAVDTFQGIAAATMYRDEGWHFMQLGHLVERAQILASLLLSQIAADRSVEEASEEGWTSLLRLYHAFEAYTDRYSVEVDPEQVADLLATNHLLPASLVRSLDGVSAEIAAIGPGPHPLSSEETQGEADDLASLLHESWPVRDDTEALLREVSDRCRALHDLVTACYFNYPVAHALPR